jgi:NitT/TauT family transport system substrate-binding protein
MQYLSCYPNTSPFQELKRQIIMKKYLIILFIFFLGINADAAEPLKIGVLLIEDSVPMYVAQQEQYFTKEGIEVELIPFLSALERDSAITARAIDGAVSDPVGAILLDQGRGLIKITSLCLGEKPEEGVFAILASPDSGLNTVDDLKNVPIAVSNATIIEYVTERLLEEKGFTPSQIMTIEVKKMPIRMQMLLSNSVKAATLPEPLASIAVAKGARLLVSDNTSKESLSQTVIIFRKDILENRMNNVKAFFKGLHSAVQAINSNPESYRSLFIEKGRVPPFMTDSYKIPDFPLPEPFSKQLYTPIMDWLYKKKVINHLSYTTMVSTDFLDK